LPTGDRLWRGVVPPFRILDPALRRAEALLPTALADICSVLPDERTAARRLNRALAAATLRMEYRDGLWRIAVRGPEAEATAALAVLVAAGGWRRLKRCVHCGRAFVDRTNGASRLGCAEHPARR
jgi:predicted RNA-binding Zn ribbon-like protein